VLSVYGNSDFGVKMANSPLDVTDQDLHNVGELEQDEISFGALSPHQTFPLIVGSLTIVLLLAGCAGLVTLIYRRGRGSWKEAVAFLSVQVMWQLLSWYFRHIQLNFVQPNCLLDCLTFSHILKFVEHLFYGGAVYSAVVLVGRLEGLGGVLMWILATMSFAAPLIFAVVYLLIDLTLDQEIRSGYTTLIALEVAKTVWLNFIPIGLLLSWYLGQGCESLIVRSSSSTRKTASKLIFIVLILFHIIQLSGSILYIVAKSSTLSYQLELTPINSWLNEAGYLLACIALPWAWLIGLLIPRRSEADSTEVNLKLAKQNKSRNIIKYKKAQHNVELPTFTSTPIKESPQIEPFMRNLDADDSVIIRDPAADPDKTKRLSYTEALEGGSFILEQPANTKSASADYLWLPSAAKQLPV